MHALQEPTVNRPILPTRHAVQEWSRDDIEFSMLEFSWYKQKDKVNLRFMANLHYGILEQIT